MPLVSTLSTLSTVTTFWEPETVRLAQWPVITTVFVIPLTVTTLLLQAIVRFSLMPVTLRLPPGGAVVVDAVVGVWVVLGEVPGWLLGIVVTEGLPVEMLGRTLGALMIEPRLENRCAPMTAMPTTAAIAPTTSTASTIQNPRKPAVFSGGAVGNGTP